MAIESRILTRKVVRAYPECESPTVTVEVVEVLIQWPDGKEPECPAYARVGGWKMAEKVAESHIPLKAGGFRPGDRE